MTKEQWLATSGHRIVIDRSGDLYAAVLDAWDTPPGMVSTSGESGECIVGVGYGYTIETAIADAISRIEYTDVI